MGSMAMAQACAMVHMAALAVSTPRVSIGGQACGSDDDGDDGFHVSLLELIIQ